MRCLEDRRSPPDGGFWTPPPRGNTTTRRVYAAMPISERKRTSSIENQVPSDDSPYVRAKHAQLMCKDPDRAISLFWAAINGGDRVDSALKDMALVMKQLDRSDEGIEAIKSFRYLCPFESQNSIDNLLLELYKKSGRIQEEAELLENKLKTLEQDARFGDGVTVARISHGKQIDMTIEQDKARILGNLAWVHLQLHNYGIAEQHYRNALSLEPDDNMLCNLAVCLMRMDRITEAKSLLEDVRRSLGSQRKDESFYESYERATEMLAERERAIIAANPESFTRSSSFSDNFSSSCSFASWKMEKQEALVAGTSLEPEYMNKTNSHVSSESVNQNSPGLITQSRECKRGDEEVYHGTGETAIGAARKLRFEISVESEESNTNKEPLSWKKPDENLIDELHQSMTSKARKMCAELIKEKVDAEKGQKSIASESFDQKGLTLPY